MERGKPLAKADLLGTWCFIEALEDRGGTVRLNPNYGANSTGFLHYLSDGRVAVLISLPGREPLSTGNRRAAPEAELAEAARTFDAYAGTWRIVGPDTVVHRTDISLFQNDAGIELVRRAELVDDVLTLHMPEFTDEGVLVRRWLVWRRLAAEQ